MKCSGEPTLTFTHALWYIRLAQDIIIDCVVTGRLHFSLLPFLFLNREDSKDLCQRRGGSNKNTP